MTQLTHESHQQCRREEEKKESRTEEKIRQERRGEERREDTHGAGREGRGGRGGAGRDGGGGRGRGHVVLRDPLEHLAHASARRRARLAQLGVMACTSATQQAVYEYMQGVKL